MALPRPDLGNLLDSVEGPRPRPTVEQRRAQRTPLRATMRITPMPHGIAAPTMSVTLHDYSPRGVRFECPRSLEQCEHFLLHVPATAHEPQRSVLCRVVHITELDPRAFLVGAEFICLTDGRATDTSSKLSKARIGAIRDAILD
jgi:hypothetical protein